MRRKNTVTRTVYIFAESVVQLGIGFVFIAIAYWIIKKANHKD